MRTGFLLAALLFAISAFAQYPNKPVRLIVPLVPGGRVALTQYVQNDLDRNHNCG